MATLLAAGFALLQQPAVRMQYPRPSHERAVGVVQCREKYVPSWVQRGSGAAGENVYGQQQSEYEAYAKLLQGDAGGAAPKGVPTNSKQAERAAGDTVAAIPDRWRRDPDQWRRRR